MQALAEAINASDEALRESLESQIAGLTKKVANTAIAASPIEVFDEIQITDNFRSDQPLDAVKCLPELTGAQ